MLDMHTCPLPGVVELLPRVQGDMRGSFVKTFHAPDFATLGLPFALAEAYHTTSRPGVIRGLHFQRPPYDYIKLICCTAGEVFDVALDLRVGSPSFGQHAHFALSAARGNVLYLPAGIAHGFCVAGPENATLNYMVSAPYAPEHDAGLRWDSAGITWPVTEPIVSARDAALPALAEFSSPFRY